MNLIFEFIYSEFDNVSIIIEFPFLNIINMHHFFLVRHSSGSYRCSLQPCPMCVGQVGRSCGALWLLLSFPSNCCTKPVCVYMEVLLNCNLYFCGYLCHVNLKNLKFATPLVKHYNTYFSPVSSLPKKWMTTVLKTKLENTVNNPAIPGR